MKVSKIVPLSERALVQRINRKLKAEYKSVKKSRGGPGHDELGEFYIVSLFLNTVIANHVDLEKLGRKLKVLAGYERLAEAA